MDQSDQISRRDAVIGVSFLGALMLALSATIVYRIVDSEPRQPRRFAEPIFAAGAVAGNPAEPIRRDHAIETASYPAPASRSDDVATIAPASPTFVAPSGGSSGAP